MYISVCHPIGKGAGLKDVHCKPGLLAEGVEMAKGRCEELSFFKKER
jgi:hypothetical protein